MSRQVRKKGEFSTYHIIQRGNERKNIFISDADRERFLYILERMKKKYNFLIFLLLMDNHVHLIINDNGNDISLIIKSINISYASYFNRTYKRCGHLFMLENMHFDFIFTTFFYTNSTITEWLVTKRTIPKVFLPKVS